MSESNNLSLETFLLLFGLLGFTGNFLTILFLDLTGRVLIALAFYGGLGLVIIGAAWNGLATSLSEVVPWFEEPMILVGKILIIGSLLWLTVQCSFLIALS